MPRTRRVLRIAMLASVLSIVCYWRFVPRPERLGLATLVDGPSPENASGVVVFLHGLGRGFDEGRDFARRLRDAGLPSDVSIVLLRAPNGFGYFGFSWGNLPEERARSRLRIRAAMAAFGQPRERVVLAGFSQGATLALDTAAEEPRIGAVASFSPCYSEKRGELPNRDLRFVLAHGTRDAVCPIEESRSLAKVLEQAGKKPRYLEFDGTHAIPTEALTALADLLKR